jgi:hypothetical protein
LGVGVLLVVPDPDGGYYQFIDAIYVLNVALDIRIESPLIGRWLADIGTRVALLFQVRERGGALAYLRSRSDTHSTLRADGYSVVGYEDPDIVSIAGRGRECGREMNIDVIIG